MKSPMRGSLHSWLGSFLDALTSHISINRSLIEMKLDMEEKCFKMLKEVSS
jgi:hypothetical protein